MAWYGNHVDASKKLDQLIDQTPNLQQLLNYPDFIQQLKAYNPKLLDYLTNSSSIITDLINYITVPPKENESDQRKYKLPTLAIEMIQSQSMSIINSFFRQDPKKKQKYFILMFEQLLQNSNKIDGQILPILAGYFLRVNICLLNNKYKQTIDCMYQNPKNFDQLLDNSHSLSVTNTLQVYLNLDLTKNSQTIPERLNIKINTINRIVKIIDESVEIERKGPSKNQMETYFNAMRVENLSSVLTQLLEKYYLIADGKQMVDQILCQQGNIKVFFKYIFDKGSEISISLLSILTSIIKYYSFSSFNTEEWNNPDQNKKNQEKLQTQPTILILAQIFPDLVAELNKCKRFGIYQTKIVELLNTSLTLNSHKIFNCVKNCKYLETLIQLLFRFQSCNIFGMMLEKLFLVIFRTEKLINEQIKHYIFCQAKIIDLTAGRYLSLFQNDEQVVASMNNNFRRRGFFGHLMKLMKIYSGIQTTDQDIINAIKNKSQIWNKISRLILKPFQAINFKDLGSYDGIIQNTLNQYTVKLIVGQNNNSMILRQADNTKLIDEINREEAIQNLKTLETSSMPQNKIQAEIIFHPHRQDTSSKGNDDEFFNPAVQVVVQRFPNPINLEQKVSSESARSETLSDNTNQKASNSPPALQKKASYNDFIERQKIKADTQIKKQRSRSKQRALSKGKTKITSPSPTKRVNKWAQNPDEKTQNKQVKQRINLTTSNKPVTQNRNLPKIPMQRKGIHLSSNANDSQKQDSHNKSMQLQKKQEIENDITLNKSMPNLQQLKQVKIIYQFELPTKKQYRKITEEDKTIFDMLGIAYS